MLLIRFPKNVKNKLAALNTIHEDNKVFVDMMKEAIAREYKKQLLRHIENQDLNWRSLNPQYKEWKIKNGLSEKIWKATSLLKDSIQVIKNDDGSWFVGISGDIKYPDGTSVSLVAMVHEYGSPSRGIPARPLFRPTRQKMLRNIGKFVATENSKYMKFLVRKINNRSRHEKSA